MDTKRVIFATFAMFFIINGMNCDGSCPVYTRGDLQDGQCTFENSTAVPHNFIVEKCEAGQYCPGIITNSTCTTTPKALLYPGSTCSDSTQCKSLNCTSSVCVGKDFGVECATHDECNIGAACAVNDTLKVCMRQSPVGANCTSDYECQNAFGCYSGVCTSYFSLPNGNATTNDNLCASGYSFKGACVSLKNLNSSDTVCNADADCFYQDQNNTAVTVTGACTCGYNKDANKYCKLGSDNDYYRNYIAAAKNILADTSKCHTVERGSPLCVYRVNTDKSVSFRRAAQSYGNNYIMAKNFPLLVHADTCVKYVAFSGYNENPIIPDTFQCAKFSCNKTATVCLHSANPFNDDGSNVTVTIAKTCNTTQSCYVTPTGMDGIYSKASVDGQCVTNPIIQPTVIRLPGEECTKDDDCIEDGLFNSTCTVGKCTGLAEKAACNKTLQCMVGLYCANNGTEGTCTKQIGENGNCTSTYDCANNYFCYNSTCKAFGSLPTGSDVSNKTIGDFTTEGNRNLACEFGTVSTSTNGTVCSRIDYDGTTAANVNADGFVNCTWGSSCSYTDGANKFSYKCGCGYNADGTGYCPLSHKQSKLNF